MKKDWIFVFDPFDGGNKPAGYILNGVFNKSGKYYYTNGPGYCISCDVFPILASRHITKIRIYHPTDETKFQDSFVADWFSPVTYIADEEHGLQRCLPSERLV